MKDGERGYVGTGHRAHLTTWSPPIYPNILGQQPVVTCHHWSLDSLTDIDVMMSCN